MEAHLLRVLCPDDGRPLREINVGYRNYDEGGFEARGILIATFGLNSIDSLEHETSGRKSKTQGPASCNLQRHLV
jgi:hypothetical protein